MLLNWDVLAGTALLLTGALMLIVARGYPAPAGLAYGAGFFPKLVALGLMLSGGLVLLGAVRGARPSDLNLDRGFALRAALLVGMIVIYASTLEWVGFHLATAPLLLLAGRLFGARWWPAAVTAVLATIGLHALFYSVMHVTLPWGWLQHHAW